MHEWPQCESCAAALYGTAKVRLGPFVSPKFEQMLSCF